MKCEQPRPGYKCWFPKPFPITITESLRAPPQILTMRINEVKERKPYTTLTDTSPRRTIEKPPISSKSRLVLSVVCIFNAETQKKIKEI